MKRLFTVLALAMLSMAVAPTLAHAGGLPTCQKSDVQTSNAYPLGGVINGKTVSGPEQCMLNLSTFTLPDTWDGKGFDASSAPQQLFASHPVTLTRNEQSFQAGIPECGGVQVDLHPEAPPNTVDYPEGVPGGAFQWQLFVVNDQLCQEETPGKFEASSSIKPTCGTASVTVTLEQIKEGTKPEDLSATFEVLVDGKTAWKTTLTNPGSQSHEFSFKEDSGVHDVMILLDGEANGSVNVRTNCEKDHVTPPPSPTPTPTPTPSPQPAPPELPQTGPSGVPVYLTIGLIFSILGAGVRFLSTRS